MAVFQNAYAATIPQGFPGMVVNGETSNRISRSVEDAAGIAFGKAVFRGVGDHAVTGTPGTASTFLGFTISNHGGVNLTLGGAPAVADLYGQNGTAGVMTLGSMWVNAAVAVADDDPVYITSAGLITNVATGNVATGWEFDNTTTAAGLVRIVRR